MYCVEFAMLQNWVRNEIAGYVIYVILMDPSLKSKHLKSFYIFVKVEQNMNEINVNLKPSIDTTDKIKVL